MTTTVSMSGPGTTVIVEDTAAAIKLQTAQLVLLTTAVNNLSFTVERIFGVTGSAIDGTMAHSAAAVKVSLNDVNNELYQLRKNQGNIVTAMQGVAGSIAGSTNATLQLTGLQSLAIVNQIKKDEFEKQATLDSLDRVGYEHPKTRSVTELIKESAKDASLLHTLSEVQANISAFTSNLINSLKSYIMESSVVIYAKEAINSLFANLKNLVGITSVRIPTPADAEQIIASTQAANAPMSRTFYGPHP